jgi:hypothetical protein
LKTWNRKPEDAQARLDELLAQAEHIKVKNLKSVNNNHKYQNLKG